MSAAASYLPRYVPAQIEAHERIKEIRKRIAAVRPQPKPVAEVAPANNVQPSPPAVVSLYRLAFSSTQEKPRPRTLGEKRTRAIALVCRHYGVTAQDVLSERRSAPIVSARRLLIWLLYRFSSASLPMIGDLIGRDHTTVLHNLRAFSAAYPKKRPYPCKRYVPPASTFVPPPALKLVKHNGGCRWTAEEIAIVRDMRAKGATRAQIAERINRTVPSVGHIYMQIGREERA